MELTIGTKFNTPFESGCVATSKPDSWGNFMALDSDGVECNYHVVMVCGFGHPMHGKVSHECNPC